MMSGDDNSPILELTRTLLVSVDEEGQDTDDSADSRESGSVEETRLFGSSEVGVGQIPRDSQD